MKIMNSHLNTNRVLDHHDRGEVCRSQFHVSCNFVNANSHAKEKAMYG